jgi:phosphotransferase system HPr-like phosphotransfer protein
MKLRIKLDNMEEAQEFVNIASKFDYDIDLKSGVVYLDAKSFLGVYSMGLKRDLEVICPNQDETFRQMVSKFAVA